jgi:polyhydroxyalkanoate synthesis regulator phasin
MEEQKTISNAKKRWLVREIESGRMTIGEAKEHVEMFSKDAASLLRSWHKKFAPEISFTLPIMTEKEKQKLDAAHKRMRELEKQLEDAQMKNIALETMIDIAEEQLRISIRKKSGPKQ